MKRSLIIGALALACSVGLSVPLIGADGVVTGNLAKNCKAIRHDETKLVWNATHTKKVSEIVYKIVPETATLDGYKPDVNVAIAVVVTKQMCSGDVSPATGTQLSRFETIDGAFASADRTWTAALLSLSTNATVAQISKPSLAFVPAIKTFDTALSKIAFSGRTATAIASVIKLNSQLVTAINSMKSTKSFISEFSALNAKYLSRPRWRRISA
jgi:hypothetical protein